MKKGIVIMSVFLIVGVTPSFAQNDVARRAIRGRHKVLKVPDADVILMAKRRLAARVSVRRTGTGIASARISKDDGWRLAGSFGAPIASHRRFAAVLSSAPLAEEGAVSEKNAEIPDHFELGQNFPNPFNPTTTITFSIPDLSTVSLKIFDHLGRQVGEFGEAQYSPGIYSREFDASSLASGLYVYRIHARSRSEEDPQNFIQVRKMLLIK